MTADQDIRKRIFDFILAALLLIVSLLILIPIAIAIKIEDGGHIFSRHLRAGKETRLFVMYKLRTTIRDMDMNEPEDLYKLKVQSLNLTGTISYDEDQMTSQYVTKVGRLLRIMNIDDLPQLWNVVIGNMSIVGPRPEIPEFVTDRNELQLKGSEVKPGITGLAHVNNKKVVYRSKMKREVEYIDSYSIKEDLKIIIQSIKSVFTECIHNAHIIRKKSIR